MESSTTAGKNRLAKEKSPYLLQHADNPVDWYPWGEEAFAAAREQDKPIFLSIGYSTCHWCHVMEHESFENDSIAALMNDLYICIKVDREERPDVDQVYMAAVQAMTRQGGGWPLSVFLTPDLKPFFGGTYFPPKDMYGRKGFPTVLRELADVYHNRRDEVERLGDSIQVFLSAQTEAAEAPFPEPVLDSTYQQLAGDFDTTWGGFRNAPKFPRSVTLSYLLRYYHRTHEPQALEMVTRTLDKMADGGIHDHLGGGFHRYATDERWLVPHFEKMLYDNALIARSYIEAYQVTHDQRYRDVARGVFDYLLRDMRSDDGAFYSAEDADSEGKEGKFYVWSRADIDRLLGEDSDLFCAYYDVTDSGNFEGENILWTPRPLDSIASEHGVDAGELRERFAADREKLLSARDERVRPGRDDKVLTAWNGLTIGALALGSRVLNEPDYLEAAEKAADFLLSKMWDGKALKARWADGEVRYDGYLDDYAFLSAGLMDLYEASFEAKYLQSAFKLLDAAEAKFATPQGGYYFAPESNDDLLVRPQDVYDGAMPSGVSVMTTNLLRRTEYTGDAKFRDRAIQVMQAYGKQMEQRESRSVQMMCAVDMFYSDPVEVVIAGTPEAAADLLIAARSGFAPNRVVMLHKPGDKLLAQVAPIVEGKEAPSGEALAYVCRNFACQLPTADSKQMFEMMK